MAVLEKHIISSAKMIKHRNHRFRGVEAIDTFESKHYTKRFFLTVDVRNIVTSDESLVIEFDSFLSDEISLINDVRLILAKHFSSDVLQFNRLN